MRKPLSATRIAQAFKFCCTRNALFGNIKLTMGFRFSRHVSIMPGLKLNLSKSGVSVSTGVRGAHLTLGSRGLYGAVGIPGTGLSYRQRLDGQARSYDRPTVERRLSARQIEAQMRRDEQENNARAAQQSIDDEWEHYQCVLNFWKPLPEIPSLENFVEAQAKRPFKSILQAPHEPVWMDEQSKCLNLLAHSLKSKWPCNFLPDFFARRKAKELFPSVWPEKEAEIQKLYADSFTDYQQRLQKEQEEWDAKETDRVAWLQRLTAGDMQEVKHTLNEIFTGLALPFKSHSQCRLFFDTPDLVSVNLELPEIEEIIFSMRKKLLKNGEVREVLRNEEERNRDYFDLITGECAFMAAEIFSYLPLCQAVRLAAYTQRPKQMENDPIDSYVLDVKFPREELKNYNPETTPMRSFLIHVGARFDQAANFKLQRIEPPSWLKHEDVQHASAE
jgi:hypothetical protein